MPYTLTKGASGTDPALQTQRIYEARRDVLAVIKNNAGANTRSSYTYVVNAIGQRTTVSTDGSAFSGTPFWGWGYDSYGQIVSADSSVSTSDRAYGYDAIGNRKKSADSLTLPASDNYTANALNQYTAVNNQSSIINPQYDADGNMTSGPLPANLSANSTLVWDGENRLTSTIVNSVTTSYVYDSQSRRIAQTTGSASTVYVYDGWNPIAE